MARVSELVRQNGSDCFPEHRACIPDDFAGAAGQRFAFSTVKVYLAAILACHVGFEVKTAGQQPLILSIYAGS